ncbi:MAG: Na+/H+ antiporter NhaA [Coriobacteriia bacterium]|nr:Na+/H+ antiporter NhaA [Coriobacteriia bacterium]
MQKKTNLRQTIITGFQDFFQYEAAGAVVMLIATIAALIMANTSLFGSLNHLWSMEAGIFSGSFAFGHSYIEWIDDALMAIFFFVVGLEIKREILVGELSTLKGAALPVMAALGGILAPALIYTFVNHGGEGASGWGIPMATDIAFALGALALLGSSIPRSLKVFLSTLAVADDIGAIIVIGVFYSSNVVWGWLAFALIPLGVMILLNRMKVDSSIPYIIFAVILWFAFLNSGIHATLAGVIAAFTIPATAKIDPLVFTRFLRLRSRKIEEVHSPESHILENDDQQVLAYGISQAAMRVASPLQRLEHAILPMSNFFILPLFALANAEIRIVGNGGFSLGKVGLGVVLGLVLGKPLGVFGVSWLGIKTGLFNMPKGMNFKHLFGGALLAGIGFTMSIFVSNIAFRGADATEMMAEAKIAILAASVISGIIGFCWLKFACKKSEARSEAA